MNYRNYIDSKSWIIKKKELFANRGYFCDRCGENRKGFLDVHHKHYRSLGKEDIHRDLAVLCKNCHSEYHNFFGKEPDEFSFSKFITWKPDLKKGKRQKKISSELKGLRKQSRKYKQFISKGYIKPLKEHFNLLKAKKYFEDKKGGTM